MLEIEKLEIKEKIKKLERDQENLVLDFEEAEDLNMYLEACFRELKMLDNFIPLLMDEDVISILKANFTELTGEEI